ncbi:MAG TPA: SDR family NAD(P)-dependent oxidoreductase, partial [Gaiella sp.]|nr:SDR family NAD(P)-dependent oxidoreductase [Gaiella sp.]
MAVVTGGAGGIGSSVCRVLAEAGFRLVVGFGRSREQAEALAAELPGALALATDVTDSAALGRLAADVERELGGCDVLVNGAGVTRFVAHGDLDALDDELIDTIFRTNVRGAFA